MNDSPLKNVHYALSAGVFGKPDVGRIVREFPEALDWELGVGEADPSSLHEGMMSTARRPSASSSASCSGDEQQEQQEQQEEN
ncbi:hypothetical protein B0H11DRAFT_2011361 [Mycena galericulata]|nr:hypothetical protein B0H11DRAFT_2011361 [Mycena galericulata]